MSETLGRASDGDRLLAERYELGELVGRGGMAEVHRAHDRRLDRTVAVKVFRTTADPLTRRRFDDEAHALARLAHPGLVSIFDVGTVGDRPFLVMEFVDGTSVQSRLLAGPLRPVATTRIGGVLADALAHAHHRGVVHRDVKPSNIMLDRDDLPHLTDFGIALLAGAPRLTSANEIVGTPAYLAPEQLSSTDVGPAADVYALALVLLECLSGEIEYPSGTTLEVALARLNRPPRVPEGLPPDLAALLSAMTSTKAADRPTAQECATRLLALSDGDQSIAPTAVPALPAVPAVVRPTAIAMSRRLPMLAASVAGIAAVIVVLVLLVNLRPPLTGRPIGGVAHAQSGPSTGAGQGRAGSAGSAGPGDGSVGANLTPNRLVVNEHPVLLPTTTAPTVPSSTQARPPSTSVTTPSSTTSPPPPTTTATDPPSTSDSGPPVPTSPSGPPNG